MTQMAGLMKLNQNLCQEEPELCFISLFVCVCVCECVCERAVVGISVHAWLIFG